MSTVAAPHSAHWTERWLYRRRSIAERALLSPLSIAWSLGERIDRALSAPRQQAPWPVIAVSSPLVGGGGKTPVAIELTRRLATAGHRVALMMRGSGRATSIVVPGERPLVEDVGDEVCEAAAALRPWADRIVIVVGRDRAEGASALRLLRSRPALVVVDEGHHHRSLAYDLLFMVGPPEWRAWESLPVGPLRSRELPSAAIEWHHSMAGGGSAEVQSKIAFDRITKEGEIAEPPERVHLVTAIARPQRVAQLLAQHGIGLASHLALGDHARFRTPHLPPGPIITTAKDAPRLRAALATAGQAHPFFVVHTRVQLMAGEDSLARRISELLS